ncbi:hypothetical protein KC19_8G107600, partial [Ceratodon purpureus]
MQFRSCCVDATWTINSRLEESPEAVISSRLTFGPQVRSLLRTYQCHVDCSDKKSTPSLCSVGFPSTTPSRSSKARGHMVHILWIRGQGLLASPFKIHKLNQPLYHASPTHPHRVHCFERIMDLLTRTHADFASILACIRGCSTSLS